jgi:aspartyl protease family protein
MWAAPLSALSAPVLALLLTLALPQAAWAQAPGAAPAPRLSLNGSLGQRAALLVLDGEALTLSVGQSLRGVRLISVEDGRAVVEVQGRRQELLLGTAPASLGERGGEQATRQIVLSAGPGGHFLAQGQINGRATQFLVDTGATSIAMAQSEAERLGLRYREGRRVMTQTANGQVPAHVLTLASVRVGQIEVRQVEAIVVPAQMSHVLLGNSFLSRFQMKRENDLMTLELRY